MVYMIKVVNNKTRYYKLDLQLNLFGEFIVINTYGSNCNKSPTGVIENYFKSKKCAESFLEDEKMRKMRKNYKILKE